MQQTITIWEQESFFAPQDIIIAGGGLMGLWSVISSVTGGKKDSLSNGDIVSGLKEALKVGTERGVEKISSVDGFFKDAAIKILMPEEAKKCGAKNYGQLEWASKLIMPFFL